MAKVVIDGQEVEAPDGAPLVEVIKNAGVWISNLCYVDGLPPYAGCRTCLVEIEGMRGLQLACTTKVADGMVVRTNTPEVLRTRQAVLSLILSYHSDRCLTCHREVKCMPGDTCLRDNVVTHRCLTCSKNYRCELQTTCEMLRMAGYEPWEGEERTYYTLLQPPPDRGNPFLEFDPQMCIICTRCVRVCDEIRHTGAIALAGRGFQTRIQFGAGGPVHESNCDFCGSCIDVCPTATLMERPNKWAAAQVERWVPTTCTWCAVGCSVYAGVRGGRIVIVKPDPTGNPVSGDQLCVRGRFHYDFVRPQQRLHRPLILDNGVRRETSWEEALELTARRLLQVRQAHGPEAIAFLGSPFMTNEESYLLTKLARGVVGSPHIDSSLGPVARAASQALQETFGTPVLPASLGLLAQARTLLVVADDLESTHNVAALRAKDAVVRKGARLVVVSPRWGELCDFASVWLQPHPGQEASLLLDILRGLAGDGQVAPRLKGVSLPDPLPHGVPQEQVAQAVALLREAISQEAWRPLCLLYALPHVGPGNARATTSALAALAMATLGEEAPSHLIVLPQEANVWGMLDMGVSPSHLPGPHPLQEAKAVERVWGMPLAAQEGMGFWEMVRQAGGKLRALVVAGDNPLFFAPARTQVREALARLEFLCVIDSIDTDTAALAHVVLPEAGPYAKEGTFTSGDRRILRLHAAATPAGEARPAWAILQEVALRLARHIPLGEVRLAYTSPAEVMDEIAQLSPFYRRATYMEMENGAQQDFSLLAPSFRFPSLALYPSEQGTGHILMVGRGLFTSYEAAALGLEDADRLHREEHLELNPRDAAVLGVGPGQMVVVSNERGEIRLPARITEAVAPGTVFIPLYWNKAAALSLLSPEQASCVVHLRKA
jgi:predicted molibdopterin-dependent oxidoreductase YjgC